VVNSDLECRKSKRYDIEIPIQEAKVSKKNIFLTVLAVLAMATPALAVDVAFHGDLNNRFNLYTNQSQLYRTAGSLEDKALASNATPVEKDANSAVWGDIKYRLWTEASSNDGAVKGVYAIELGAIRFGQNYAKGGGGTYSGDGVNIETRWAYTDIQLPFVQSKARVLIGLQPWNVNSFVWNETVMGVQFKGDAGPVGYTLGWARGHENYPTTTSQNAFQDADALLARADLKPAEGTKLGLFALWQRQDAFDGTGAITNEIKSFGNNEYGIYTLGVDGGFTTPTGPGNFFVNWDAIYQGGTIDQPGDLDVSAYLVHADVGVNVGAARFTYTGWYASGDDNDLDGDINNFMSTDVDRFDSIVLFEGGYTDDNYVTEAPYLGTVGLILNKIAADVKATEKTAFGGAVLYLMTAEDVTLASGAKGNVIGTEIDAYISHKLYPNVEVAVNAGYLFSDEVVDAVAVGGDADDIFRSTMRVRYSF